jgi:hypothetical protein
MAKMPYVALYIAIRHPNQKNTWQKNDTMAVGVGRVFAFWGDLDRQRRRRVRFVQGAEA